MWIAWILIVIGIVLFIIAMTSSKFMSNLIVIACYLLATTCSAIGIAMLLNYRPI
jgi:hypothetical protein